MPIAITCPACSKEAIVPDTAAGKHLKCSCENVFLVAGPTPIENIALNPVLAKKSSTESAARPSPINEVRVSSIGSKTIKVLLGLVLFVSLIFTPIVVFVFLFFYPWKYVIGATLLIAAVPVFGPLFYSGVFPYTFRKAASTMFAAFIPIAAILLGMRIIHPVSADDWVPAAIGIAIFMFFVAALDSQCPHCRKFFKTKTIETSKGASNIEVRIDDKGRQRLVNVTPTVETRFCRSCQRQYSRSKNIETNN